MKIRMHDRAGIFSFSGAFTDECRTARLYPDPNIGKITAHEP